MIRQQKNTVIENIFGIKMIFNKKVVFVKNNALLQKDILLSRILITRFCLQAKTAIRRIEFDLHASI